MKPTSITLSSSSMTTLRRSFVVAMFLAAAVMAMSTVEGFTARTAPGIVRAGPRPTVAGLSPPSPRTTMLFLSDGDQQQEQQPQSPQTTAQSRSQVMVGPAEQLILDTAHARREGLVQELGRTVRKDGLDDLRAIVWSLYHASNVIIPIMASIMILNWMLLSMGYGVYLDESHTQLHVDTLPHIQLMLSSSSSSNI